MSTNKKTVTTHSKNVKPGTEENILFTKDNYKWMLIGVIIIAIGFFLMAGGKSDDPNVFNPDEIYGLQRITIAPILIVAGLVIEIYAIMKKQK